MVTEIHLLNKNPEALVTKGDAGRSFAPLLATPWQRRSRRAGWPRPECRNTCLGCTSLCKGSYVCTASAYTFIWSIWSSTKLVSIMYLLRKADNIPSGSVLRLVCHTRVPRAFKLLCALSGSVLRVCWRGCCTVLQFGALVNNLNRVIPWDRYCNRVHYSLPTKHDTKYSRYYVETENNKAGHWVSLFLHRAR